jgi:hypothetical protein
LAFIADPANQLDLKLAILAIATRPDRWQRSDARSVILATVSARGFQMELSLSSHFRKRA